MPRNELHPRTAIINKKQKNQSKLARQQALNWLAASFPDIFDATFSIRPLKKKIMQDILQYAVENDCTISLSKIREAVVAFTRRIDYLTCLKAREMRIDLNNNPVEQVTEEEAEKAALKIKKRVEKSARNARKVANEKCQLPYPVMRPASHRTSTPSSFTPTVTDKTNFNSIHRESTRSSVTITHKVSRNYDSSATVARLKEKLGLNKNK